MPRVYSKQHTNEKEQKMAAFAPKSFILFYFTFINIIVYFILLYKYIFP